MPPARHGLARNPPPLHRLRTSCSTHQPRPSVAFLLPVSLSTPAGVCCHAPERLSDRLADVHHEPPRHRVYARQGFVALRSHGQALSGLHPGLGRQQPRPLQRRHRRGAEDAGRQAAEPVAGVLQRADGEARGPAHAAQRVRQGVLHEQRRGSERRRDQARAQVGPQVQERRIRDHHVRPQLPRPHARDDVGQRQAGLGHDLRTAGAGLPEGRAEQHRVGREADHRQDRRRDARTDPGRRRRDSGDARIHAGAARADEAAQPAADRRRSAERLWPRGHAVRVRAVRHRAGRHDAREGHRRRRTARRAAVEGRRRGVRGRRPGRYVQRQPADDGGRLFGDLAARRARLPRRRACAQRIPEAQAARTVGGARLRGRTR